MTLGTPVQAYRARERVKTLLLLLLYRLLGPVCFIQNGVVDTMLSPRTRAEDPAAVRMVRDCLVHADRARLGNAVVSISLRRPDLSRFLRRVSAPTLFITGTDHQGWTPVQAEAFSELLPDGSVAVVPDTAYLTQLEAPTETARLIRQFWAIHAAQPNPTQLIATTDQLAGHAPNRRTGDHPVIHARCRFRLMKHPGVSGASWDQASSLSLAMGLTTILTTIWVCPPKYAEVQNPYFYGRFDI